MIVYPEQTANIMMHAVVGYDGILNLQQQALRVAIIKALERYNEDCAVAFKKHCEWAAAEVEKWPEWKRKAITAALTPSM